MKKILFILIAVLLLPYMASAQDTRNRTVNTVVADALAQLPAQEQSLYNSLMADLGSTGTEGVVKMAGMLVPADKGQNATVEYALNGLVAYATAPGRESMAKAVADGLIEAIATCNDVPNKCFLITLLGRCGDESHTAALQQYLSDDNLREHTINTISMMKGGRETIARLVDQSSAPDLLLARAAWHVKAPASEDKLIAWAAEAPVGGKYDYYRAMSRLGGAKSFKMLDRAAKADGYRTTADNATRAYTAMITEGARKGFDNDILKSAKQVVKSQAPTFVRGAALAAIFNLEEKNALPELIKAVSGNNRQYRVNALRLSEPWADSETCEAVNKTASKNKDIDAVADVINWYAATKNQGQIDYVVAGINNANPEIASAAIKGAAMIGGDKALSALSAQLYGPHSAEAAEALMYFSGDITDCVNAALQSSDNDTKALAVMLAGKRHVKASLPGILAIIDGNEPESLKAAAYNALAGVATVDNLGVLVNLASKVQGNNLAAVSSAIKAVLTGVPQDRQYALLQPYLSKAPAGALYSALAQCGSPAAVQVLRDAYAKGDMAAFDALLTVDGNDMIPVLFEIATTNPQASSAALKRYASLAANSGYDGSQLYSIYTNGLEVTDDPAVQNLMIAGLGETKVFPVFAIAQEYIAKPETAAAAAAAIRTVASKNNYSGDDVVKALEAAKAYYVAEGSADSGYAVDDINGMIQRMAYDPVFHLSPEEQAEGFEVLFDGTSLDRWKGNKTCYVPVDGAIYVTAQYGGGGNLYTDKEYSDFIYRFEFCFDSPGVNNGIGIRTTENVDAAYHGMEIQVLEHDAPIYADLRPYQVHGSVYGIIPAKRIVSPEPGTWNTEEIRAVGDHITVTVNGEVIVDGNIRKACKGHNVAPDGSRENPYTVDHLNHPGLFNKQGLISFCGHGPGVRFRNIRIKDLSKKQ